MTATRASVGDAGAICRAYEHVVACPGPRSVAFLDLMGLGAINRRWGDDAGHLLLHGVEHRLSTAASPGLACRLGADEYLLALPQRDARSAMRHTKRLLRRLAAEPLSVGPHEAVLVAARAGGATASGATAVRDLYAAGADALQQAKRNGLPLVWMDLR